MAPLGPQTSLAWVNSSSLRWASEPANCAPPASRALRPAPEPSGEYCTVAPDSCSPKPAIQDCIAESWEEAPTPESVPAAPEAAGTEPPPWLPVGLSEPQAVSASAARERTAAARPKRIAFTCKVPFNLANEL